MIQKVCAICETNKDASVKYPANFKPEDFNNRIFSARRLPDKIHYQIWECQKCGLIFSSPIEDNLKLAKLYAESKLTYRKEIFYLKKTYGRYLKEIEDLTNNKENLLEIGCGNGFFLEEAKKQGYKNVHGVEPGREVAAKARPEIRKNITIDIFRKKQFKKNFFDLVCIFQTIDHVPDPCEILSEVWQILKPRGLVFIISHNTSSFSAGLLGEKSPIFDLEHIYLFNTTNTPQILRKHHFKTEKVFNVANSYPISYWLRMLPIPILKKNLLNFLSQNKIWDREVTISAGNFGAVGRKA